MIATIRRRTSECSAVQCAEGEGRGDAKSINTATYFHRGLSLSSEPVATIGGTSSVTDLSQLFDQRDRRCVGLQLGSRLNTTPLTIGAFFYTRDGLGWLCAEKKRTNGPFMSSFFRKSYRKHHARRPPAVLGVGCSSDGKGTRCIPVISYWFSVRWCPTLQPQNVRNPSAKVLLRTDGADRRR